jgi:hypothetical protein
MDYHRHTDLDGNGDRHFYSYFNPDDYAYLYADLNANTDLYSFHYADPNAYPYANLRISPGPGKDASQLPIWSWHSLSVFAWVIPRGSG